MRTSPYELLGVGANVDADALRKAYRRRAHELHPDVNPDDLDATRHFQELAEAYALLADPERRAAYDASGPATERAPNGAPPWEEPPVGGTPAHRPAKRPWPGCSSRGVGGPVLSEVRVFVRRGRPSVRRRVFVPGPAQPVRTSGEWWSLTSGSDALGREFWISIAAPPGARGVLRDTLQFELQGDSITVPIIATVVGPSQPGFPS